MPARSSSLIPVLSSVRRQTCQHREVQRYLRHYYLRQGDDVAEVRINLAGKKNRELQSHDIGLRMRNDLQKVADRHRARMKLVETPPGPPVIASVVAEIYGQPDNRYSDLLSLGRGRSLFDAIMESRVVRLRPILLTACAAMLGAVPIIIDPIFSGLAWSLIFGLFASTLFTLLVIPVAYWLLYANTPGHGMPQSTMEQEESAPAVE